MCASKLQVEQELSMEELREIELGILDALHEYCEAHDLRYWLMFGTLLGAVRHGGFIPWDDDIDISMPTADYIRFMELQKTDPVPAPFEVTAFEIDEAYHRSFAKMVDTRTQIDDFQDYCTLTESVYIDIVPFIGLPADAAEERRFLRRWTIDFAFLGLSTGKFVVAKGNLVKTIAKVFCFPIARLRGYKYYLRRFHADLVNPALDFDASEKITSPDGVMDILPSEFFAETVQMPFAGNIYHAPARYDEVLTGLYGDYRQLPPLEEQVTIHTFSAWRKTPTEES